MTQEQINLNWHTYSDHLKDMMQNLMQSNNSTDVTLVCEDKTRFKAHKFVLSASSPVFESIITDLPHKEHSIIYLRGVLSQEMKSILQFLYLGQATFYQDRMNEFINVAKILEVKEISKVVECDATDESENDNNEYIESCKESSVVQYQNGDKDYILEKTGKTETKLRNSMTHEVKRYSCDRCEKSYSTKRDLLRHIKSFHEGVKFQCNQCDYEYTHEQGLHKHKRNKH